MGVAAWETVDVCPRLMLSHSYGVVHLGEVELDFFF